MFNYIFVTNRSFFKVAFQCHTADLPNSALIQTMAEIWNYKIWAGKIKSNDKQQQ